ncbi:MAG: electron transfer flavoprotein subunit alpha/FixB family protein [Spirochaetaceae bacterium]|nr:electron transfer flavoprotein subunit alpha/FixB family protein [Spirochaetaceae bacterium]RKX76363.1 MAG: electron transfer flavoprotein subunit alpha [Spirochaetota bacterium]RKX84234.1 MAG: electron transfer flavoprotein subunit alpha [Spirochaetota bacterium]RKX93454.1 MAG: electron transfer flavoprotein subunit alpha [Spirochaetota bacterium]
MKLSELDSADNYNDVWVLGEVVEGKVHRVTLELLGKAKDLAEKRASSGSKVVCLLMGYQLDGLEKELFSHHADKVIKVDDESLKFFNDSIHASVVTRLVKKYKPEIMISGATSKGRSLMPLVAVKLETGLTADCTGLEIDEESGLLLQTRPAYGGNIIATIKCEDYRPQMSTVRQGVFKVLPEDVSGTGELISEFVLDEEKQTSFTIISEEGLDGETRVNLHDANVIVTGGRGVKSADGFKVIHDLADAVNGAVGATRATIDSGWISYSHQVGQTGLTVQPEVYIACGVSGQIQHLVGMQSSDFIIAINKDPDAPIMKLADVAIVGDLFEVVPEITKLLSN